MNIDSNRISDTIGKVFSKLGVPTVVAVQFTSHVLLVIALGLYSYNNYQMNKHDQTISMQKQTIQQLNEKNDNLKQTLQEVQKPVPISQYPVVHLSKATDEMAELLAARNWKIGSANIAVNTCRNSVISVLLDSSLIWE